MQGQCVVNHALREVGRGALLVLGELVADAVASAVPVPPLSLVQSCRHLGPGGALLAVHQGGEGVEEGGRRGGRGGRGGERYPDIAVSRNVVVQGVVSATAAWWVPDARISVQGVSSPTTELDLKGGCARRSRNSAVGCWSETIWAGKKDRRFMHRGAPVLSTAAGTILLDAEATQSRTVPAPREKPRKFRTSAGILCKCPQ